jgi:DNA-binding MurR/RpiR family transcriptional regulator
MLNGELTDADALCAAYLASTTDLMQRILTEERTATDKAAARLADQIAADRLIHIFGPGGHSNLAAPFLTRERCSPMGLCAPWRSSARPATARS